MYLWLVIVRKAMIGAKLTNLLLTKGVKMISNCCVRAPPLSIEYTKESTLDSQVSSPLLTQVGGSHYKDKAIQPIEYCYKNKLGPCETLAIWYISQHKTKNGKIDIEKAIHSLQLLLELEYKI